MKPTSKPNPGSSTGEIAGTKWILPVIICVSVLILVVLSLLVVMHRRKSAAITKHVASTTSYSNPLYNPATLAGESRASVNTEYADVPDSTHAAEPSSVPS